jgi:hypothetical protein
MRASASASARGAWVHISQRAKLVGVGALHCCGCQQSRQVSKPRETWVDDDGPYTVRTRGHMALDSGRWAFAPDRASFGATEVQNLGCMSATTGSTYNEMVGRGMWASSLRITIQPSRVSAAVSAAHSCTTLHYTTLHYTTLHYTSRHDTTHTRLDSSQGAGWRRTQRASHAPFKRSHGSPQIP